MPAAISRRLAAASLLLTALAAGAAAAGAAGTVRFASGGLALAATAAVIGQAVEAVGERLGPAATGLLQSSLGNLPELFVGLFALHDGLIEVVKAALVGSILANAVLVLGSAFVLGGLRHGPQRFDPSDARLYGTLLLVAVAALLVPTLASRLDTPAAAHAGVLSDLCAAVLLAVYAAGVVHTLRRGREALDQARADPAGSLLVLVGLLVGASALAALSSELFVSALVPATRALGLDQVFTGLVVVAIASNAVEHAVGIRFALRAKPGFAISTTLSSPLQVALLLTPVLVLVSGLVGPAPLTLVFPPLLVAVLAISALVVLATVYDGEYTWVEGVALIGLYVMIAASFWWG